MGSLSGQGWKLCLAFGQVCRLGSLVMWDQRLCSTVGQGCWFGFLPKWGWRMGSAAAQILWSGFLYGLDDGRLHSAVKWGYRFASLPG